MDEKVKESVLALQDAAEKIDNLKCGFMLQDCVYL